MSQQTKAETPKVYAFELQEYEVNLVREALELYKERFRGPWVKDPTTLQYGYAPNKKTRRLDFIIRRLAREAAHQGLTVPPFPWPQGFGR